MDLAIACMIGRAEQLRHFIKNRESDIQEMTRRLAFAHEQIKSSEEEIASLERAVAAIGGAL